MARYCIAFDTIKMFSHVSGTENLSDLVGSLVALCYCTCYSNWRNMLY